MNRLAAISLFLVLIFAFSASAVLADATIEVNTAADENGTGTDCSLREAITAANTNADFGGCVGSGAYGTDTITFNSTTFSTAQTITLTSALPDITTNLTISGPGADLLTISGNNLYRPFRMSNAFVFMSGMTVSQGRQVGDNGGNIYVYDGQVTLDNMVVSQGYSSQNGGGAAVQIGDLNVRNSLFSNNTALQDGAGIFNNSGSTLTVTSSTFSGNYAANTGGAIRNSGTLRVSNSTLYANSAYYQGDTIWTNSDQSWLLNVTMHSSTIHMGGGLFAAATTRVMNSILAGSMGGQDCVGSVIVTNSFVHDGSCGITNGVDGNLTGDPMLSALANNGGPTQTMALPLDSPAANVGNNSLLSEAATGVDFNGDGDTDDTLTTDQRGNSFDRAISTVDMGAFEAVYPFTGLVVDTDSDLNLHSCSGLTNDCSLRGAINLANSMDGTDTITFDSTVFNTSKTILLTSGLPIINTGMSIVGPGASVLTIDGSLTVRPFHVLNASTVSISGITVMQGLTLADGGNILAEGGGSVTLSGMVIKQGVASKGAGIAVLNGSLIISNSLLSDNSASQIGGGIFAQQSVNLSVINSTFSNNHAAIRGGGIGEWGTLRVTNSTFYGNSADTEAGGISILYGDTAWLVNITMSDNSAPDGSAIKTQNGMMKLVNSIIANGIGGDACVGSAEVAYTLVEDGTCLSISSDSITGDPMLGALTDNGGTTPTMALTFDSPAANAGYNLFLSEAEFVDYNGDGDTGDTLTTDQRGTGFNRIIGDTVDMGAFEAPFAFSGLVVDTTSDNNLTDCTDLANDCSLRGAINLANSIDGADTITFDSTVFSTSQTITLTIRLPDITSSITIDGPGASLLTISGNDAVRPFYIDGAVVVTLSDMTISHGKADFGGAIVQNSGTLTVSNSVLSSNVATAMGGAIHSANGSNDQSQILIVLDTTFSGNSATDRGGAINSAGTLKIFSSTFNDNTAGDGGSIYSSFATIANSTFSGNNAAGSGGAIYTAGGELRLFSTTISANSASLSGGAIYANTILLTIRNSILANSIHGGNCTVSGPATIRYSLIESGGCGITNGVDGNRTNDPKLGSLQNNGGPTQTIALQSGSPAFDSGDNTYLNEVIAGADLNADGDLSDTLDTDQRGAGHDRVIDNTVNLGAYEGPAVSPPNAAPTLNYALTNTVTLTWNSVTWATAYQVEIADSTAFTNLLCGGSYNWPSGILNMQTCVLTPGTYYWHVRAVSPSATSAWSAANSLVIGTP